METRPSNWHQRLVDSGPSIDVKESDSIIFAKIHNRSPSHCISTLMITTMAPAEIIHSIALCVGRAR